MGENTCEGATIKLVRSGATDVFYRRYVKGIGVTLEGKTCEGSDHQTCEE